LPVLLLLLLLLHCQWHGRGMAQRLQARQSPARSRTTYYIVCVLPALCIYCNSCGACPMCSAPLLMCSAPLSPKPTCTPLPHLPARCTSSCQTLRLPSGSTPPPQAAPCPSPRGRSCTSKGGTTYNLKTFQPLAAAILLQSITTSGLCDRHQQASGAQRWQQELSQRLPVQTNALETNCHLSRKVIVLPHLAQPTCEQSLNLSCKAHLVDGKPDLNIRNLNCR
jgi:hypothetical protein